MHDVREAIFWSLAGVALLLLIALLNEILLPFVAGIGIAFFLNPVAARLESFGLPRIWASVLIVLTGTIVLIGLLIYVVPLLAGQLRQLVETLPADLQNLKTITEAWARERLGSQFPAFQAGLERAVTGISENWSSTAGAVAKSVWSQGSALVNFLSLLLVTPVVVFYLLVDWNPMLARVDGWLPREHASNIRALGHDINEAVSAFVRGQGTICLILGVIYAVGLSWIGVRYGALIGLGTGILCFIPFVGWSLGLLTSAGIAITQFWPDTLPLLKVLMLFGLGQALDAGFLSPKIVGTKIGLHPVWLIFALFVFSYLFGFVGVLVAVPMAAAMGVLIRFALKAYLKSSVYRGEGEGEELASGSPGDGTAEAVRRS